MTTLDSVFAVIEKFWRRGVSMQETTDVQPRADTCLRAAVLLERRSGARVASWKRGNR